ncbi:MAG: septum site-determining protein MinC [Burkholderiaceae bacterium]|nr:septum site-determining protein MinC [Burkholderiaceae bacterium]
MTQAREGRSDVHSDQAQLALEPLSAGPSGQALDRAPVPASRLEVFDLKGATLGALSLVLRTADLAEFAQALQARLGDTPDVFNHDLVVIELSQLAQSAPGDHAPDQPAALDFPALAALLRRYRLQAVGVSGATPSQLEMAQQAGLCEADLSLAGTGQGQRAASRAEPVPKEVVREVVVERIREVQVAAEPARTVFVDKPLRSGQQVYAKGADLVVLALVNHGAEVIADGSIHVYAPLRGKAIAGARGNADARIFAASLEAELIAIAGIYRTTENPLPEHVAGKPAQVRLEGEKLVMEALER